jgi:hypothetical protein
MLEGEPLHGRLCNYPLRTLNFIFCVNSSVAKELSILSILSKSSVFWALSASSAPQTALRNNLEAHNEACKPAVQLLLLGFRIGIRWQLCHERAIILDCLRWVADYVKKFID